jgi:hypothetical protein
MGSHPLNLALCFLLEIAALVAIGCWGLDQHSGIWHFIVGVGAPLIAAALWGTFAVPDDPSRSGKAPVPIPGVLRWYSSYLCLALLSGRYTKLAACRLPGSWPALPSFTMRCRTIGSPGCSGSTE